MRFLIIVLAFLFQPQIVSAGDIELEPPSNSFQIVTAAITPQNHSLSSIKIGVSNFDIEQNKIKAQKEAISAQNALQATGGKETVNYASSTANIRGIIVKWANYYSVSVDWLLRVANCESGYNVYAFNAKETPGNSPSGIFQFKPQTFKANAARIGIANPDIWDPAQQAQVAAYMFSIGQSVQWACK